MNVNDGKWFRSMGAEKLMEAEEREREDKEMDGFCFGSLGENATKEEQEKAFKDFSEALKLIKKRGAQPKLNGEPIAVEYSYEYPVIEKTVKGVVVQFIGDGKAVIVTERGGLIEAKLSRLSVIEREVKDMSEIKEATVLEAVPSNTVVLDKCTGKKMILLSLTATDEEDYYIAVNRDGELSSGRKCDIAVLLTDKQKKLLEELRK